MLPSSMETSSVMSPPYTGFLRQFDPQHYFNRRNTAANTVAAGSCTGSLPVRPATSDLHASAPTFSEPIMEPLDLRTSTHRLEIPRTHQGSTVSESMSEIDILGLTSSSRSGSESPAKLVLIHFCECFTGKNQVGDLCACYCNGSPVYLPRSRLLPIIDSEKATTSEKVSSVPQAPCHHRSPSMTFSSLDESPSQLVVDFSSSDTELKETVLSGTREERNVGCKPHGLSHEARRIYDFASDEELKSLGPFSSFRCNTDYSEHIAYMPCEKQDQQIKVVSSSPPALKAQRDHQASKSAGFDDMSQNLTMRPQVPGEEDPTTAKTANDTQLIEQNTQDYNADISASYVSVPDSSDLEAPDASVWFVKQDVDNLKLKLCKTFIIGHSDQVDADSQDREGSDAKEHERPVILTSAAATDDARQLISSCFDRSPRKASSNMDTTQRFIEGRSICEASTIFSVSPTFVHTPPMSSCVSYPDTPDISYNKTNNVGNLPTTSTPSRSHAFTKSIRKSSTPSVKGPVTLKDACKLTKCGEETSLRKVLFQKKLLAQGSDSVLNIGFTSDLEIDPQISASSHSKQKSAACTTKKAKSKTKSIFKILRQKMMCQNNLSVMASLENTQLQEQSCSERLKAALEPLTTKSIRVHPIGRPSIQVPLCGKTATTSTATVAFATLNETKQFGAAHSTNFSLPSNVPRAYNMFSSESTVGTMPSLRHLVAPVDLSFSHTRPKSLDGHVSIEPNRPVANQKSDQPRTISTTKPIPTSVNIEKSPFKIPHSPRALVCSSRKVHPQTSSSDANVKQCERNPLCNTVKESGIRSSRPTMTSESSLSESNVTTSATQQSFEIVKMKHSAREVAELLTAFINDASMAQFGARFQDTLSKSMLFSLCEKCEVRVKESRHDPNIVNLVKSRRSQAPTEEDVKQLIRRARRTRNPRLCSELL